MKREDIIRMARESGLFNTPFPHPGNMDEVERFAALVAAHVRETEFKPDWTNYRTDDLPTQDGFPHCPYCGKDI